MNAHDNDAHLELAALYSAGALPELERARFESHLADGCATCEAELAQLRPAIDALVDGVVPVAPRPQLRERLLARAAEAADAAEAGEAPRERVALPRPRSRVPLFAAAASVALAVGLAAQTFSLSAQLRDAQRRSDDLDRALAAEQQALQQVRVELEGARAERAVLTAQISELEATARVLTAPATRAIALAGQGEGKAARARAFLSPDTRTVILYAYDLPDLPADRAYQAWVIPGKTPVSIGVLGPGSGGVVRHEAAGVAGLEAPVTVAVTIEPLGGLPQPSGPIVLAGR